MSENGLTAARHKMRDAGIAEQAIDVFSHYYRALDNGATCLIPEDSIEPLTRIDSIEDVEIDEAGAREALSRTVLIKLNGGLGTSMGMDRTRSRRSPPTPASGSTGFLWTSCRTASPSCAPTTSLR